MFHSFTRTAANVKHRLPLLASEAGPGGQNFRQLCINCAGKCAALRRNTVLFPGIRNMFCPDRGHLTARRATSDSALSAHRSQTKLSPGDLVVVLSVIVLAFYVPTHLALRWVMSKRE
jgi:hypothetical protein